MKIIYRTFFLAILLGIAPMLVGQNDTITLEDIVTYHADYGNGHVSYQFDPSKSHLLPNFSKENLFTLYKHLFNISINKHDSVSIDMENVEGTAIRKHYDAVQLYKGVPIEHSQIRITEELGFVEVLGMNWTSIETRESGIPTLSEAEALNKAIEYVPAKRYLWGNTPNPGNSKYKPKGTLLWIKDKTGSTKLAYKFYITTWDKGMGAWNVFVDAHTGELAKKESQLSY